MSDEARELFSDISDLADKMSEEWSSKPESETYGIDYEALYADKASDLIDAAFAKVREECADRAYEALVALPTDTPRPIYAASIARAAILGKDR